MSSAKKLTATDQKRLTEQLQQLTHATPTDAARILKNSRWDINVAVEAFFQDYAAQENASARGGDAAKREARDQKLKAIFKTYEDPKSPGQVTVQTISEYFSAIGIEDMDTDVAVYIVSYELKSQSLGDLELKSFCEGWGALKVDSIRGMANQVPLLKKKFLTDPEYFKKVYKFVFELGKEDGAKVVVREMAVAFWQCLLPPVFASKPSAIVYSTPNGSPGMGVREFGWWTEFLEEKAVKGVSKDLWHLFIEYAAKIPNTYDLYDDDGAWPSILDDFTEYAKSRRTKEGGGMDLS